jgi:hypothetical protein
MIFTLALQSEDEPPLTTNLTLDVRGRVIDPDALVVLVNGVERRAQWSGSELTFDECIVVRFAPHSSKLVHEMRAADLPEAIVEILNAVCHGGPEVVVAKCDVCDALAPAALISAHTLCLCPECQRKKGFVSPTAVEDPPF